jgi:hypothetical protein
MIEVVVSRLGCRNAEITINGQAASSASPLHLDRRSIAGSASLEKEHTVLCSS